ncbi:MAG: hypothetical protein Q7R79_00605 [bacterium]|nr:hypothetical protein [bacterium]
MRVREVAPRAPVRVAVRLTLLGVRQAALQVALVGALRVAAHPRAQVGVLAQVRVVTVRLEEILAVPHRLSRDLLVGVLARPVRPPTQTQAQSQDGGVVGKVSRQQFKIKVLQLQIRLVVRMGGQTLVNLRPQV